MTMTKEELYDNLIALENVEDIAKVPSYWEALTYLCYCDECILQHQDAIFTERLKDLIAKSHCNCGPVEQCDSCGGHVWPYGDDFIPYALNPEGPKNRNLMTEFFPSAFRKSFEL